jgi:hypothetical protein
MSFVELRNSGRSTDYPFGFLQVKLNAKGEGSGQIMGAARFASIRKKDNTKSSYGNQYVKATNVPLGGPRRLPPIFCSPLEKDIATPNQSPCS